MEVPIGQDVPSALEPVEIRSSRNHGPYATKTKFDWTLNRPFGSFGTTEEQYVNYVRTDELLSEQFDRHESRVQ